MATMTFSRNQQSDHVGRPSLAPPNGVALKPIADMVALDVEALSTQLAEAGMMLDRHFQIRQFAGGLANLNYLLSVDGHLAVLRRPPGGPLPPGANDMKREHRILSRLWRSLALAPRSRYFCEDEAIIGAPFQILDYKQGTALRGASLAPIDATAANAAKLSQMMIDTLSAVHAVDPASVDLQGLGRPEGFFVRTALGWLKRGEIASGGEMTTAAREVGTWITSIEEPLCGTPVLLHNDFKLDNILLAPDTLSPLAVVDWDMGSRGPALFDLATLLSYWTEPGDPECMQILAQMPTVMPGFMSREQAALAYAQATGRSLDGLKPFRVLTVLKLAVVFLQLHRRFVAGETRDPRYAGFGELGNELFVFALDVAHDRYF